MAVCAVVFCSVSLELPSKLLMSLADTSMPDRAAGGAAVNEAPEAAEDDSDGEGSTEPVTSCLKRRRERKMDEPTWTDSAGATEAEPETGAEASAAASEEEEDETKR